MGQNRLGRGGCKCDRDVEVAFWEPPGKRELLPRGDISPKREEQRGRERVGKMREGALRQLVPKPGGGAGPRRDLGNHLNALLVPRVPQRVLSSRAVGGGTPLEPQELGGHQAWWVGAHLGAQRK